MNVFIYQSDLYCEDCGRSIRENVPQPDWAELDNEHTWDSSDWPKGPCADGGGEAGCPQHCAGCGCFLENPLTSDGVEYVRKVVARRREALAAAHVWAEYYGIDDARGLRIMP